MKKLIVFTGAGISAESGIQTFRDSGGLWEGFDIHDVATAEAWERQPEVVQEFYNKRREKLHHVEPNKAHIDLAKAEKEFEIHIITQNVDDLHERGGSSNVLHLHGELKKARSEKNPKLIYPQEGDVAMGDIAEDGAQLRPHIVLFGESVPMMDRAMETLMGSDALLIIGTSLQVYPAAGIVDVFPSEKPIVYLDQNISGNASSQRNNRSIHFIEKSATEGISEALEYLKSELY